MAHAEENWQSRAEIRLATWDDMDDILRIFDMGRTVVNISGDTVAAIAITGRHRSGTPAMRGLAGARQ